MLRNFFAREEGQGLVEYALILVLIAIVVIVILTFLGGQVSSTFSRVSSGRTALLMEPVDVRELIRGVVESMIPTAVARTIDLRGRTVVPGRLLVEIVRVLPPDDVVLEQAAGGGALRLTCGSSEYTLHTQSADDFPQIPLPGGERFTVHLGARVAPSLTGTPDSPSRP